MYIITCQFALIGTSLYKSIGHRSMPKHQFLMALVFGLLCIFTDAVGASGTCPIGCVNCDTSKGVCSPDGCDVGFITSPINKGCVPCPVDNCLDCRKDPTKCDICKTGYTIAKNGTQCTACPPGPCNGCTENAQGTIECASCTTGYVLNGKTKQCLQCPKNCNMEYFLGCVLNSATGKAKCNECADGYGLAPDGSCKPCKPNCTCKTSGQCTGCISGNYLTPTKNCAACGKNCNTCQSASKCKSVSPLHFTTAFK